MDLGLPHDERIELQAIVGGDHLLTDADLRSTYETDWTGRWSAPCAAVVRPADRDEVAAVLALCDRRGIAVVPQGGNTGLVGGGVPRPGTGRPTVVVSTRRLQSIGEVDTSAAQVTLGAGVTITAWRDVARGAGWDAPIDFAARDSATIGGAIATNAGGSRVVRFGTMRQQVSGIEAVLADGSIVGSLAGLPKETVGMHWPSLLAGSEGTLAIVTAARLRLAPNYPEVTTALVAMRSLDAALEVLGRLRAEVPSLDAAELILPAAAELVSEHTGIPNPVAVTTDGVQLLVECADHHDRSDDLLRVLASAAGVEDSAIATSGGPREALVARRDRITEAIAADAAGSGTPTFKLDVAVPVRALPRLVTLAQAAADDAGARLVAFGHLAEGNLHLNYLDAADPDDIARRVLPRVAALGGTISAEHGVGVAKSGWMHLVRTSAELDAQAAIRLSLDPHHILNPGVLEPR